MEHLDVISALPLDILARAGGGGSSSGGDGGGLIALIGYLPMHFLGAKLRKYGLQKSSWPLFQTAGWIVCAIYCLGLLFLGFWGVVIGICAILGTGAGLYSWFSLLRRSKKVDKALQISANADPTWDEASIIDRASAVFYAYQKDWSARDWQSMRSYMTAGYAHHSSLMVSALVQARRINDVRTPQIQQAVVIDLVNSDNDNEDMVTVGINAKANDRLIDDQDNSELYVDNREFTEYWQFRRQGTTWLLDGIQQATAAGWLRDTALQKFAQTNGYYYSLDWGWLLIPKRGMLFGKSKFGSSDINNHIIGVYNQYYLLQLYTYIPDPRSNSRYVIAQTNLPKSYGNIVVRRKKPFVLFGPKGLRKISMEWGDFNKKYEVYASSAEGAASFELLHPAYMEKLEALSYEVNIEVVDNVVYLYAPQNAPAIDTARYASMLEILREAYKQMKL